MHSEVSHRRGWGSTVAQRCVTGSVGRPWSSASAKADSPCSVAPFPSMANTQLLDPLRLPRTPKSVCASAVTSPRTNRHHVARQNHRTPSFPLNFSQTASAASNSHHKSKGSKRRAGRSLRGLHPQSSSQISHDNTRVHSHSRSPINQHTHPQALIMTPPSEHDHGHSHSGQTLARRFLANNDRRYCYGSLMGGSTAGRMGGGRVSYTELQYAPRPTSEPPPTLTHPHHGLAIGHGYAPVQPHTTNPNFANPQHQHFSPLTSSHQRVQRPMPTDYDSFSRRAGRSYHYDSPYWRDSNAAVRPPKPCSRAWCRTVFCCC